MLGTKMGAAALLLTPPTPEGRDPPSLRPKRNPKTGKLLRKCGQTKSVVVALCFPFWVSVSLFGVLGVCPSFHKRFISYSRETESYANANSPSVNSIVGGKLQRGTRYPRLLLMKVRSFRHWPNNLGKCSSTRRRLINLIDNIWLEQQHR